LIEDQLQGYDLAAETKESAMYYVGYRQGKRWSNKEFFADGAKDVKECTADFFKKMNFNPDGKRMLDIGCGIGRMARAFGDIFGNAYGVDFSSKMIELAKEINKDKSNVYFGVNNGVDLSIYQDNFFDFCFSYIVFHHIRKQEVIMNYIREIDRVLRPGGLFMFQVNTSKWSVTSSPPARGGASLLCVSLLSCSFWEELKLNTLFRFRLISHVLLYFIRCYFVSHSSDEISISPKFFAPASSGKAWEFTEDLIS